MPLLTLMDRSTLHTISTLGYMSLTSKISYLYNLSPSSLTIQVLRLNAPGKAEDWQSYNFTSAAESHGAAIGMWSLRTERSLNNQRMSLDGPHVAGMAVYLV